MGCPGYIPAAFLTPSAISTFPTPDRRTFWLVTTRPMEGSGKRTGLHKAKVRHQFPIGIVAGQVQRMLIAPIQIQIRARLFNTKHFLAQTENGIQKVRGELLIRMPLPDDLTHTGQYLPAVRLFSRTSGTEWHPPPPERRALPSNGRSIFRSHLPGPVKKQDRLRFQHPFPRGWLSHCRSPSVRVWLL